MQDFGTTYSGVACASTTQPDKIYTINEWPGMKGRSSPKCLILIKYDALGKFKWGFEFDRIIKERIDGIKQKFNPDQPKPLYVLATDIEAELKRLGESAMAVASDFLGAIFQHAFKKMKSKLPEGYLDLFDK